MAAKKVVRNKTLQVGASLPEKEHPPLKPTTTAQQDIVTAGQRKINLIWECTQGVIAIMITTSVIYTVIKEIESDVLTNAFFLIVSMYFVRTNHNIIGGVGTKHGTR